MMLTSESKQLTSSGDQEILNYTPLNHSISPNNVILVSGTGFCGSGARFWVFGAGFCGSRAGFGISKNSSGAKKHNIIRRPKKNLSIYAYRVHKHIGVLTQHLDHYRRIRRLSEVFDSSCAQKRVWSRLLQI